MMDLKELRKRCHMTQVEASDYFGISVRSYKAYENDSKKWDSIKYKYMVQQLMEKSRVDETHGILSIDDITEICEEIFREYPISYCFLFGSYARGEAKETSDIDLLVSSEVRGLKFYGLVEALKTSLKKNVDVLTSDQLLNNNKLLNEVLRDGVRIYGK